MARVVVKRCACKRTYTAKEWRALPFAFDMKDEHTGQVLEFRHCVCKSTISVYRKTRKGIEENPPRARFPGDWTPSVFVARLGAAGFRTKIIHGGAFDDVRVSHSGENFGSVRIFKKDGRAAYDDRSSFEWAPWQVEKALAALEFPKGNPGRPTGAALARAKLAYRAEHWGKGGKQKPRELSCANPFAPGAGPVVVIGRLVAIEYETDKLGDGVSIYRHEVTSRDATIGHVKGKLVIGGGKTRMTVRGIVG